MIDNNDILDLLWQNWIDEIDECLQDFFMNYGRYLYTDSFDMAVDEVMLKDIENISVDSFDIEKGNFGKKTVRGNANIDCLLQGVCYFDREYHNVGEITIKVPMAYSFDVKNRNKEESFDNFSCECVINDQ